MIDSGDREGLKYEEYLIEHEISSAQAKNAVLAIDLRRGKCLCGASLATGLYLPDFQL